MIALRKCSQSTRRASVGRLSIFSSVSAARRFTHDLVQLPYPMEAGLGDFLSASALRVIANDYQKGLLERLTEEVAGTELEDLSVVQTVISAASSMDHVLAFNYASQALNNSFFLDNLKPPHLGDGTHTHENEISPSLRSVINHSFGSIDQLKSNLSATALGMMGSGWVWLVCDQTLNYVGFLASYGPGTVLVRSREQRHPAGLTNSPLRRKDFPILGETREDKSGRHPFPSAPRYSRPFPTSPSSGTTGRVPLAQPSSPNRTLMQSSLSLSPLSIAFHRQNISTPRFSQSPLPLPPLERLSKRNSTASFDPTKEETPEENATEPPPSEAASQVFKDMLRRPTLSGADFAGAPFGGWDTERWRGKDDDIFPLLCISVQEHAWMAGGYGVWGKEEYLRRYWSVVDWGKVSETFRHWGSLSVGGPTSPYPEPSQQLLDDVS